MAITATLVKSDPYKLTYQLLGDAAATTLVLANALLQTDAKQGSVKNALNQTYANQAAMRQVFGQGAVKFTIRSRDGGAGWGTAGIDVDVDAVTATKPKINLVASTAPAATVAYLDIEFQHSIHR